MLIPIADVLALIPVARSTLYLRMAEPDFPKPVRIGGRVFWEMQEILAYIESRRAFREVVTAGLPACSVCGGTQFKADDISGYLLCAKCSAA